MTDLLREIENRLAALPSGSRGPRASRLAESLTQGLPEAVCWPWLGRIGRNGYGIAVIPGDRTKGTAAHRLVWTLLNGRVPDGWHIDHLCHDPSACDRGARCTHRSCVNPAHLKAVPAAENVLRGSGPSAINARLTTCRRGHSFTAENTYIDPRGRRSCRTCQRAHWRRYAKEARDGLR